jgi:hypothetical protein
MQYYAIVPATDRSSRVQGIFRVNDDGIPEQKVDGVWKFNPHLTRFLTGSDIGYKEIEPPAE